MTVYVLNSAQKATGQGQTVKPDPIGNMPTPPYQTVQVVATTTTGNVTATVQVLGSNDGVNFSSLGTAVTIASGASPQVGSVVLNSTYKHYAANVTALTGTGAAVTTLMSL